MKFNTLTTSRIHTGHPTVTGVSHDKIERQYPPPTQLLTGYDD